ncbi:MAG TPA: FISUMP domain-containing protein [Candidatus Gastranaerophilales bacterium]|nr:FISUMP domain-containing protein [Candidatus Gastranaerophilales bacterium]
MKRLFTSLVLITLAINFFAQPPQKMSFEAVIRNSSGQLVTNQAIGLKISILQGSTTGAVVYAETQKPTTNANGLASVQIGDGTVVTGAFAGIDWSSGTYFIKTETDPTGGTNYSITGTSQLLSVPYALYARMADTAPENQNLNDVLTQNNSAGNKNIINLADPINDQDAVTKAYIDAILSRIEAIELVNFGFTDSRDGNHYDAVKIGNQTWMADNLKYLPSVNGPGTGSTSVPFYYVYGYNGTVVNEAKASGVYHAYGVLYNWPAAMAGSTSSNNNPSGVQGVCPVGWHLPSGNEWSELMTYLGGELIAGGKLKESGTIHWNSPNAAATNETGFTALPGGLRGESGTFLDIGGYGYWWTCTAYDAVDARSLNLRLDNGLLDTDLDTKSVGFSVRCLKDN